MTSIKSEVFFPNIPATVMVGDVYLVCGYDLVCVIGEFGSVWFCVQCGFQF